MNSAIVETVETASGKLAGLRKDGITRFKGVPFAKPPAGRLRWRMPEPAEPWAGTRDATKFGTVSPQAPTQLESLMGMTMGEQSEDCLFLNVWTPGCDSARRPVMVWIHGGAFVIGAGSQGVYNGKAIASRDVVIVTINYRLGAFGFLDLSGASDGRAPGTGAEGLADQVLALHWVKENISAFGGDPENVTIFGESAGGMSIGALLASPAARGLYHKAIAQSGAAHIGYDKERSARVGRAMLDLLDIAPEHAERAMEVPYGAIIRAQISVLADSRDGHDERKLGRLPFQPAIDGGVLAEAPLDAIKQGSAHGIPVMTGTTLEEWKLFTAANPRLRMMSTKSFNERVERLAGSAAPEMIAAYAEGSPFERFNAVMTDKVFTMPAIKLLEVQAAHAPVFGYRFDWRSPILGGLMGSCHALELGFVFGTYRERMAGTFFGTGAAADALSNAMIDAWVNFARHGNPGWQAYETPARATMIFGDGAPHILDAPNEARRTVWDRLPERRLGP